MNGAPSGRVLLGQEVLELGRPPPSRSLHLCPGAFLLLCQVPYATFPPPLPCGARRWSRWPPRSQPTLADIAAAAERQAGPPEPRGVDAAGGPKRGMAKGKRLGHCLSYNLGSFLAVFALGWLGLQQRLLQPCESQVQPRILLKPKELKEEDEDEEEEPEVAKESKEPEVSKIEKPADAEAEPREGRWVFCAPQWHECTCEGRVRWGQWRYLDRDETEAQ